jgi:cytochrome c peroxidase
MKHRLHRLLIILPALLVAGLVAFDLGHGKAQAQFAGLGNAGFTVPPCTLPFDMGCYLPGGTHEDPDVAFANADIINTENATVNRILHSPPTTLYQQLGLLGKAEIYDMNLSVNRNLACATCHLADDGFKGPASLFNNTIVALPGSVPITNVGFNNGRTFGMRHPDERTSQRNPMTYAYAPFFQPLAFNALAQQFIGGNFWDMRATGDRIGNPAAEQAEGPPLNPVEMALPDEGCVVYRLSLSKYAGLFKQVFGAQVFDIHFPSNVVQVCSMPGGLPAGNVTSSAVYKPGNNPVILKLSPRDRGQVGATFDFFAEAIAAYEASPAVSPFSSKFDAVLQGKATFTASEERGFILFNGKAICATCHTDSLTVSGTNARLGGAAAAGKMIDGIRVGGPHVVIRFRGQIVSQSDSALFTNEEAVNLGIPKDWQIPYLYENKPDQFGYVANSLGPNFVDFGVGAFLLSNNNPNPFWRQFAPQYMGAFQTVTLRDVDKRIRPNFVKGYMHNGYLKSLKEVVHFYNTRDVLPRCPPFTSPFTRPPGEGVTCWSAPEVAQNENKMIGNLHLTPQDENDLVAFLKTLTDGFIAVPTDGL